MFSRPSTPPRSALLALLLVGLLSSCAPTILGRTPQPAAPGEAEVIFTLGYPFIELTHLPPGSVCAPASPPDECYAPGFGPTYLPIAYPLNLLVAYGLEGDTEVSGALSVGVLPALRVGGKTRLLNGDVPLAVDYGAHLGFDGAGADAGLLVSVPLTDAELYGALRGFGSYYWVDFANLTGALTAGTRLPLGQGGFFAELTLATTALSLPATPGTQPFGFSLIPAVGFQF